METIEYNGKLFKRYGKYFRIGNLYLHRVVWTDHNGPVPANHHIHHIDHDQANNAIENLAIMTRSEHQRHHIAETRKTNSPTNVTFVGTILCLRDQHTNDSAQSHAKISSTTRWWSPRIPLTASTALSRSLECNATKYFAQGTARTKTTKRISGKLQSAVSI